MGKESKEKLRPVIFFNPRLLDVDLAAQYLGMAPKTLRNRLGRRAKDPFPVKPKRHGKKLVFEKEDLDAYATNLPYEPYV